MLSALFDGIVGVLLHTKFWPAHREEERMRGLADRPRCSKASSGMGCTERRKGDIRVDRLEGEVRRDLGERIFGREVREGGQRDMGFQFCPLIQQAATGSRIETARRRDFKESGRSNSRKVEESLNSDEIKVEIQRQLEEGRKKLLTEVAVQLEKEKEAALAVLDNVKNSSQIEALIGKQPSFGGGSRIILTTRDKQSLSSCMIY